MSRIGSAIFSFVSTSTPRSLFQADSRPMVSCPNISACTTSPLPLLRLILPGEGAERERKAGFRAARRWERLCMRSGDEWRRRMASPGSGERRRGARRRA
uniref:Si496035e06 n=1 Tax=Arundo donax TaxID=35708 RepID=A0A0A9FTT5_ARUDO